MPSRAVTMIRDPGRRERIVEAAAELIAQRGYQGVSLDDIGATAGVIGSGIYRHFGSKAAILVEMSDRAVDWLLAEVERLLRFSAAPKATLTALVRGQVEFTLGQRFLCEVYPQEVRNVPLADLCRLKWKQRH